MLFVARVGSMAGLQAVAATLGLLRYPELDLSHLYVRDNAELGASVIDLAAGTRPLQTVTLG